jgi:hypothetical protein
MAKMMKHEREGERRLAQSRPTYAKDVADKLGGLGGKSRADVTPDNVRAASSPLGARKMKEKR